MKKMFLTLSMLCLIGVGFVSQTNAMIYKSYCEQAALKVYEALSSEGHSYDSAVDAAIEIYRACEGIK